MNTDGLDSAMLLIALAILIVSIVVIANAWKGCEDKQDDVKEDVKESLQGFRQYFHNDDDDEDVDDERKENHGS